ncbi:hypothetical protein LAD12857_17430 [Lacrimispora amygdalina]|uniref:RHS repeat protein n=1 Tax=Lacrimispora amygdalina TaxID=253257 RepID=A0ABQ5M5E0_9FIRM
MPNSEDGQEKEYKNNLSYAYDSYGNILTHTDGDGNGNRTTYDMDKWGRIQRISNGDGGIESYTYDRMGNVTSTTDPNGGDITYRYSSQGKVCEGFFYYKCLLW